MKNIFIPFVETLMAAFFIAGAPFIFFYGLFPLSIQRKIWMEVSPDYLDVIHQMQVVVSLGMVFTGLYLMAGVWGAYPQYRGRVIFGVLSALGSMAVFLLYTGVSVSKGFSSF